MADPQAFQLDDVKQWEIWEVDWEHEDGTSKRRRALAICTGSASMERGYARFVKITSQDHPNIPCQLMLDPADPQSKSAGLTKRSWIHFLDEGKITAGQLKARKGRIGVFTIAFAVKLLRDIGTPAD